MNGSRRNSIIHSKPKSVLPKNDEEVKYKDRESEKEEVMHITKEKKPKKKIKKIIIQESESDSETEEDEPQPQPQKQTRDFKSARNKKSVIKVHDNIKTNYNPNNYFV